MAVPTVKNAIGPWGSPIEMMPPGGPHPAGMHGLGSEVAGAHAKAGGPGMIQQASHVAGGPGASAKPGPVIPASAGMGPPPGALHVLGAMGLGAGMGQGMPSGQRSQIRFVGPAGAKIGWYVAAGATGANGQPMMVPHQLDVPGRYNFIQAAIYRLKLSDIPGRATELYPTVEVVPSNPKTEPFLSHNYIPVEFTEYDLDQVAAGNYVTKVIYLPDPQAQGPLSTGIEELVSTQLEPGVDPIAEAARRGHILLVVRLGGIDLETSNSPPLNNCGPYGSPHAQGVLPGMVTPVPGTPVVPGMAGPGVLKGPAPKGKPTAKTSGKASQDIQQTVLVVDANGQVQPAAMPKERKMVFLWSGMFSRKAEEPPAVTTQPVMMESQPVIMETKPIKEGPFRGLFSGRGGK
jgi:hypothetical protein